MPLYNYPAITKLTHSGQRFVDVTDSSISTVREIQVEPYEAYPLVVQSLLGLPTPKNEYSLYDIPQGVGSGAGSGQNGCLVPPLADPFHPNIRCLRCTVKPYPGDISYSNNKSQAVTFTTNLSQTNPDWNGGGVPGDEDGPNALVSMEKYVGAIITAYYGERPEWKIDFKSNNRNLSLPTQFLVWKNITDGTNPLRLGLVGAGENGTDAIKVDCYIDLTLTCYRHPKGSRYQMRQLLASQLVGRVNQYPWSFPLRSNISGNWPVGYIFPPETVLFNSLQDSFEFGTLSSNEPDPDVSGFAPLAHNYPSYSFNFTLKMTTALESEFAEGQAPDDFPGDYDLSDFGSSTPGAQDYFLRTGYIDASAKYVGWNRLYFPGGKPADPEGAKWDYAINSQTGKFIFPYAEDAALLPPFNVGGVSKGFDALFNF